MIGRVYGRLTVTSLHHRDEKHRKFFLCSCSCGGEKVVQGSLLISNNTRSCGCLIADSYERRRLPDDAAVITQIILGAKRHARDRNIEWHLTREDVDGLVRQPCHYCGNPAGNLKRTKNLKEGFPHNGIDRMDPSKPYRVGNVVPCCGTCNRAKGVMGRSEFINWARQIAARWSFPPTKEHQA